ncbi:Peroxisome biosynthesis protein pex1 [Maudiozyma exigua]|uniref:Peroxisomal ATPase PEX1 n=1 Tax=Maudiozyma exigua TaxID=34358 RepID=A0A9P6WDW6_MAUEX|nr:Peroxisome biosynthesis protein pex1 [Kazachstania exigua]
MNLPGNRNLSVKFSNKLKGNFIRIPSSTADAIYNSRIEIQKFRFRLDYKWYVSWDGFDSDDDNSIEINPVLAKCLRFQQNQTISFEMEQFETSDSMISEAYVKPLSSDDWEIAELHSNYLQQEILNQTKIVNLGGVIVCYVGNTVCKFTVDKIVPENLKVGLIGDGSLIVVEPMENKMRKRNLKVPPKETTITTKRSLCWGISSNKNEDKVTTIYLNDDEIVSEYAYISVIKNKIDINHAKRVKNKQEDNGDQHIVKFTDRIISCILPVNSIHTKKIPRGHALLNSPIRNSLFVEDSLLANNGTRLKVEFLNDVVPIAGSQLSEMSIILHFGGKVDANRSKEIQKSILGTIYLTNMQLFKKENVIVELIDSNGIHLPCINVSKYDISNIHVEIRDDCNLEYINDDHTNGQRDIEIPYVELDKSLGEIISHVSKNVLASPGVVIEGSLGVGKTSLVREIQTRLLQTTQSHIIFYDCESLQNTFNYEKMHKFICNQLVSSSYWYQPCVIILDNAEFLFSGTVSNNETDSGNNRNSLSDRLTLLLIQEITRVVNKRNNSIRVIFASARKDLLNKFLYEKHFVGKTWSLKPPAKQARKLLLDHLLPASNIALSSDFTTNDMSMELEGYSILDMKNLVQRLLYDILIQQGAENNNRILTWSQFECINETFVPVFLQGVEKTKNSDTSSGSKQGWNQIGGLVEAKRTLLETLEWPVKYSPIFQKSPLRLRSGLLIYGYPGCGKTLLANAIAKECGGLNFLPVKGPEILNKYIGASEQNVRNLFERAQSLKPCILFFDEFDSVATKRGHDSTGVTDRIVNQLLTQMDGAEKLDGVYVVAATSRPDLIDPALLRPGRLDKAIFCDIPDFESRLDILKKLLQDNHEKIDENDLVEVAKETVGYSGADLQGLYYNAHLDAVHRQLEKMNLDPGRNQTVESDIEYTILSSGTKETDQKLIEHDILQYSKLQSGKRTTGNKGNNELEHSKPVIKINDLIKCCQETRPSISTHEFTKLNKIYQEFQGVDRPAELNDGDNDRLPGTRVTLA